MTDLFSERDPSRVARRLGELERFADRRERFLEHIDFAALDLQTCREVDRTDAHLAEQLMFGALYAQHLAEMIALGQSLSTARALAA